MTDQGCYVCVLPATREEGGWESHTNGRFTMSKLFWGAVALLGMGVALTGGSAGADEGELKVGDKAPDFTMPGSDGKTYKLSQFKGKQAVVLAWYPKAFTGGCTKECKSFGADSANLKKMKVAYFTASVDTPEENKKFAESLSVDYPILSDPDKSVAKAYGVVNPTRLVAQRWTFYIDKDGVIREIDKMVKTDTAAPDVAKKLEELGIAK
jgi:thioredoxin-dependent peroxiredoxin